MLHIDVGNCEKYGNDECHSSWNCCQGYQETNHRNDDNGETGDIDLVQIWFEYPCQFYIETKISASILERFIFHD